MRGIIFLVLIVATARESRAEAGDRPVLLVLVDSAADDAKASASAVNYFADLLDRYQTWDVLSGAELKMLLEAAQMRAASGCDTDRCMMELGAALGGEYLLSVGVFNTGKGKELRARMLAIEAARSMARGHAPVPSLVRLSSVAAQLVTRLTEPLLKGKKGTLVLTLSEAGARLRIDGQERPEPLRKHQRLDLPLGPHEFTVSKTEFQSVTFRLTLRDGDQDKSIRLLPQTAWLTGQRRKRMTRSSLALGLGLGGVGAMTAAFFQQQNAERDYAERGRLLAECCRRDTAGGWEVTPTGAVAWQRNEDRLKGLDETIPASIQRAQGFAAASFLLLPAAWYFATTRPDLKRFEDL